MNKFLLCKWSVQSQKQLEFLEIIWKPSFTNEEPKTQVDDQEDFKGLQNPLGVFCIAIKLHGGRRKGDLCLGICITVTFLF
jgi:hypothetical protein